MVKQIVFKNETNKTVVVCCSTAGVTCTKQKSASTCVTAGGGFDVLLTKLKLTFAGTLSGSKSTAEYKPGQLYPCEIKSGEQETIEVTKKAKLSLISHIIVDGEKAFKCDNLEINDDTNLVRICFAKDDKNMVKVKLFCTDDEDVLIQRIADVCLTDEPKEDDKPSSTGVQQTVNASKIAQNFGVNNGKVEGGKFNF